MQIRVGINSGEVIVRSVASDLRWDYTAVGMPTHVAARMEQLATPGSIVITAETLACVEHPIDVRPLGRVVVKGLFSRPGLVSIDKENPIGVHHFCLNMEAASIDDVIADLRHSGVEIFRGPVERRDGTSVFVYDPDGVKVELRIEKKNA